MKRQKEGMKAIIFDIHQDWKRGFDAYCERRGLSMAEVLRCFIYGLEETDKNVGEDAEAELDALISRLQAKRDRQKT